VLRNCYELSGVQWS